VSAADYGDSLVYPRGDIAKGQVKNMAWWAWLIIAFAIGIVEISSVTFVLLWFAIGALVTALVSLAVHDVWLQLLVFAALGLALFVATRPLARKWRRVKSYPDRSETLVGTTGVVVTAAEPGAFATVRVQGDLWSARSNSKLEPGQNVIVRAASATILTVEPIRGEG
jgi:membrane protein implicated in regulation of membrane protease activity